MFKLQTNSRKRIDVSKLTVAPVKVYMTTDYRMFHNIPGNRDVNDRHAAELTRRISKKDKLSVRPMNVNEYADIVDGQHRLRGAETLRRPIYFIISEGDGIDEVAELNSATKGWSTYDWLDSYIKRGKTEYQTFQDFIKRYGLAIEGGFVFLFNNNGHAMYDRFREGVMTFSDEQLDTADELANALDEIRNYFKDKGYKRVYLYKALVQVRDKGYLNLLVDKVKMWNPQLTTQYAVKDYLRMFEDVLNTKNKKGEIIRLF